MKQKSVTKIKASHNVNTDVARFGMTDPEEVCNLVAQSIPADMLKNAKRILDVGIGCGGIARAIVKRLVEELYVDWDDAILRVYGVDNNLALVNKARRNGFVHTVCADFQSWDPEMQFDVIVGNPPYTDTTAVQSQTTGGCSRGLDNLFFEKCLELSPYVSLVIRSKHFAKKGSRFRKKLFSSGHLKEIRALASDVFPSISLTETCVAVFDQFHLGATKITFQNGSSKELFLKPDTCVKLTNPEFAVNVPNNMAFRYERGKLNLNQLENGDYPMIVTMGGKGKDMVVRLVSKEQAVSGVNQFGVVMNSKYGGKGFGKVCIKPFSHAVSGSSIFLRTDSEEESILLRSYLLSDEVQNLVQKNKISNANTKELFSTIPDLNIQVR